MYSSLKLILEQVCLRIQDDIVIAYLFLDKAGNIVECGGNFKGLGLPVPEKGRPVVDAFVFMEGLLPLKGRQIELSCIKMQGSPFMDAVLFRVDKGYGLLVQKTADRVKSLEKDQQARNDMCLKLEQREKLVKKHEAFLEELFCALNFAVLEMNDQGHFVLIGTAPSWIEHLPQSTGLLAGQPCEEDIFSFLGNFIYQIKSRWADNDTTCFKSGLWIEKDSNDQEMFFEACAIDIHGRKLLIISHDVCHPNETQSIIQKGRELALNYHESERAARKIDEERGELARQLRQSQKMEAIGTLAGGIAHDFNNILSAIMGFTELSLAEPDNPEKLVPRLEKIMHAAERARELIRQILSFSHQDEYEKKPVKLKALILEILNLLRASIPPSVEIQTSLRSNSHILADPTQMHQVIMNLCTNAWQAMKDNGGILELELCDVNINDMGTAGKLGLSTGDYLKLRIRDTGCGMSKEISDKIFDPYFTTKEKNKGTGLGLSVVHGIVMKSGGAITVESEISKGSVFELYFPVFDSQTSAKPLTRPMIKGNNERILFVDDEVFQTEMAEQLLTRLGYRVVTVNDSIKALDIFIRDNENFDLVILDMVMPAMNGKVLAEKMLEIKPDMPIILCSGYSDDLDSSFIRKKGIARYLLKPVDMRELSCTIHDVLHNGKNNCPTS